MKCDYCGCKDSYVKIYHHSYVIKNQQVTFDSERRFCKKCNHLVYDALLDNEASKKAIQIYNKNFGIDCEEIINLRKSYHLSQASFAKIIGCAKKTLISYEKGTSIPNDNYLIVLKTLVNEPDTIQSFIEANKSQFNEKEYQTITKKLSAIYGNNTKQLLESKFFEPTEFNGYTELNKNKILNLILYFSEPFILKTKLLKELFYTDFLCYKETGASMTGLEYAKLPYGPVPDEFEDILIAFVLENAIDYKIEYKEDYEYHKIVGKKKFDNSVFSKKELEIIHKIKDTFKNYSSKEIVEASHKEKAFIETEFYQEIDYSYAFDLTI